MIKFAIVAVLIIILLFLYPSISLILVATGVLLVSFYASAGKKGGGFIDPTFDNVFNIDKKIIKVDTLRHNKKHYIIVVRNYKSARFELALHSLAPFFGNSGQDHIVVKLNNEKLMGGDMYVINRPTNSSHLLEKADKSFRNYIIPDDSIWYGDLQYYFLGQYDDTQGEMIDLDGLIFNVFAYDFEYGFKPINIDEMNIYLKVGNRREKYMNKVNPSLLSSPEEVFIHFKLLFVKRLQDLLELANSGGSIDSAFSDLLDNAKKIIDHFKGHSSWVEFHKTENQISEKSKLLKSEFPELSDTEIQRFVRYYLLVDKNEEMLRKRLLIQILAKSTDKHELFDQFMKSNLRVDIFPVFSRNDLYEACERLVSGIQIDLNSISRENSRKFLIDCNQKLTLENIKNELLYTGTYVDPKIIQKADENNMDSILEYCNTWGKLAHNNITQICNSEQMSSLQAEKKAISKKTLEEIRLLEEKIYREYETEKERKRLMELPDLIRSYREKKIGDYIVADFTSSTEEEIKETLMDISDEEEREDAYNLLKNDLGWIKFYEKELNELKRKYS